MTKGKFTLVTFQTERPSNRARTNDGIEVEYDGMIDEGEFGPWDMFYKNATIVGYIDGYNQVTYCSLIPFEEFGGCTCPTCRGEFDNESDYNSIQNEIENFIGDWYEYYECLFKRDEQELDPDDYCYDCGRSREVCDCYDYEDLGYMQTKSKFLQRKPKCL